MTDTHAEPMEAPTRAGMPEGWEPPSMYRTCDSCPRGGDVVHSDFETGYCAECGRPCCNSCAIADHDIDGTTFHHATCMPDEVAA